MLLKDIIYRIREQIKETFDDSKVTDDYLANLFNTKRAFFIRREYNQLQRSIDNDVKQTIVMELEEAEAEDCDCGYADVILRTVKPLPHTIELHNQNLITRVASPDHLAASFSFITTDRAPYVGKNTFTKRNIFTYLHSNGHIYVFRRDKDTDWKNLDFISVTGVFDNPLEVGEFLDPSTKEPYFNYETDNYPVKQWMVDFVIQEIVKELVGLKQVPEDNENNAIDNNG